MIKLTLFAPGIKWSKRLVLEAIHRFVDRTIRFVCTIDELRYILHAHRPQPWKLVILRVVLDGLRLLSDIVISIARRLSKKHTHDSM